MLVLTISTLLPFSVMSLGAKRLFGKPRDTTMSGTILLSKLQPSLEYMVLATTSYKRKVVLELKVQENTRHNRGSTSLFLGVLIRRHALNKPLGNFPAPFHLFDETHSLLVPL